MGVKGDKSSQQGALAVELLMEKLSPLNGITTKKMFGGHGIFQDGRMFGMVDSKGGYFLKADDSAKNHFLKKGASKHSRMPYYSIPGEVFDNSDTLLEWVRMSIEASK